MSRASNRKAKAADGASELPTLRRHAAGIDIGTTEIYVAVPPIETFNPCGYSPDLPRLSGGDDRRDAAAGTQVRCRPTALVDISMAGRIVYSSGNGVRPYRQLSHLGDSTFTLGDLETAVEYVPHPGRRLNFFDYKPAKLRSLYPGANNSRAIRMERDCGRGNRASARCDGRLMLGGFVARGRLAASGHRVLHGGVNNDSGLGEVFIDFTPESPFTSARNLYSSSSVPRRRVRPVPKSVDNETWMRAVHATRRSDRNRTGSRTWRQAEDDVAEGEIWPSDIRRSMHQPRDLHFRNY